MNFEGMQYVHVTSAGKHINVFHDDEKGICVSVLNMRNRWTIPQTIVRSCLPWFSSCLDESDDLHLAFQDIRGDIVHMVHRNGSWQREMVLQAKRPAKYNKHIHMTCEGNNTYMFYVVKHCEDCILSYQTVDSEAVACKPHALDYISPDEDAYLLFRNGNDICLGYTRKRESKAVAGYRWINTENGKISEFVALPDGDTRIGALAVENRDVIHFCIIDGTDPENAIYYLTRDEKRREWTGRTFLSKSRIPIKVPTLYLSEGSIICFWAQGKLIKGLCSLDGGKTWGSMQDQPLDSRGRIQLAGYADSHSRAFFNSQFGRVFCRFSNGVKLLFKSGDDVNRDSMEQNVPADLMLKNIKLLLNENVDINNRLQKVEQTLQDLEKKSHIYSIEMEKQKLREQL